MLAKRSCRCRCRCRCGAVRCSCHAALVPGYNTIREGMNTQHRHGPWIAISYTPAEYRGR